ncbi:MAG: hypothetical protein AAGA17_18160 [Actinomycetota bacterium]
MTGLAIGVLVLVVAAGGAQVWSVTARRPDIERWAAPATIGLTALLAMTLDAAWNATRWWFVLAVLIALGAEVLRILDRPLEGRLAQVGAAAVFSLGFALREPSLVMAAIGLAVVVVVMIELGQPLLAGVLTREPRSLRLMGLVLVSLGVLLTMAFSSGSFLAVVGAAVFVLAVGIVGLRRYVDDQPWMPFVAIGAQPVALVFLVLSVIQP